MSHPRPLSLNFQLCRSLVKIFCLLVFLPGLAWADGAHPDPGHLQQTVLVILRFPPQGITNALSATDESYINAQLAIASDFLWTNSNQSLRVNFETIKIEQSVAASDYEKYTIPPPNPNPNNLPATIEYAASYNATVNDSLARRLIDPRQYAGVMMIYYPSNQPGTLIENTWIWFNDQLSANNLNPGFTSIVYQGTGFSLYPPILHEYCHQLHHRFQNAAHDSTPPVGAFAPDGFIDSDWMTTPVGQELGVLLGTTFQQGDDLTWLAAILKYYVTPRNIKQPRSTLHAVNYRWLEGRYPDNIVLGVFDGGELKKMYDFAKPDDALVYVSGDNDVRGRPTGSPPSFWFRAAPGHTAAFGTQTGFGLYLLKKVTFNYEIAPDDYTFQVHLVYFDVHNQQVDIRIDDGNFVLGRQKFATNLKVITLPVPREVEDFQIVFQKGNQLSGAAANDDWVLLGNISLDTSLAP